jgi:N,N'-diacetylbacillosaminyl-diphospho-undecaprenol alpha-1,3-N-acetylgalactosaminyltransferase
MICNTDGAMFVFRKPLLIALLKQGHDVVSVTPDGTYVPRLQALGVRTRTMPIDQYGLSPLANLRLLRRFLSVIQAEKPDIVHSFTHKPAILGTFAAHLAGVRKTLITVTGLGRLFIRNEFSARVLRTFLLFQYGVVSRLARCVFFQNPDDLDLFVRHHVVARDKAILTGGSGIDLDEFQVPNEAQVLSARATLSREIACALDGKRVVLLPARALREKGVNEFYDAAKQINKSTNRYVFLHMGHCVSDVPGGFDGESLERYARACGVRFLGFRPDPECVMAGADIVALPSAREGMPRSLLEALALGKCIVTTNVPGCRLAVRDGWNGYLCEYGSSRSLADTLLRISDDLIESSRIRSRLHCEQHFAASAVVDTTLKQYFGD